MTDTFDVAYKKLATLIDGHTLAQIQAVKSLLLLPVKEAGTVLEFCNSCFCYPQEGELEGLLVSLVSALAAFVATLPNHEIPGVMDGLQAVLKVLVLAEGKQKEGEGR
jgi:hypothetical protein